ADVFAAQYVSEANIRLLEAFVGSQPASRSHPSTADRRSATEEFLAGKSSPLLDSFQQVLARQAAPSLGVRFALPDLAATYDNIRPHVISGERELHGLFAASWNYLEQALQKTHPTWGSLDEATIERVINDLAEKSIRNMSVKEKWNYGATA